MRLNVGIGGRRALRIGSGPAELGPELLDLTGCLGETAFGLRIRDHRRLAGSESLDLAVDDLQPCLGPRRTRLRITSTRLRCSRALLALLRALVGATSLLLRPDRGLVPQGATLPGRRLTTWREEPTRSRSPAWK